MRGFLLAPLRRSSRSVYLLAGSILVVTVCEACAHYPHTPICTTMTRGPCHESAGYRANRLAELAQVKDGTLLVLAFSGGGTRASAFAYGVLRGLDSLKIPGSHSTSLLDRVNIVSGVSGGAFTAAHFALFGREGFREFENNFLLNENLRTELLAGYLAVLQPHKWFSPHFARSDYLADQWDRLLFHKKTFGQLENRRSGPFLLISATNIQEMSPFPFVQERFDSFCSDMSAVRIARAVAASSAFPGFLSPITFEIFGDSHGRPCGAGVPKSGDDSVGKKKKDGVSWFTNFIKDTRVSPPTRSASTCTPDEQVAASMNNEQQDVNRYAHLIDGGVTDNLAICLLLRGMEVSQGFVPLQTLVHDADIARVAMILVDAGTSPGKTPAEREESPGFMEVISSVAGISIDARTEGVRKYFRSFASDTLSAALKLDKGSVYLASLSLLQCSPGIGDPVNSLPTTFGLRRRDVRRLISLGAQCVMANSELNRFRSEIDKPIQIAAPTVAFDTSLITAPIYFDSDKALIRPDAIPVLNRKVTWLQANPGARIRIEGNDHERGSDEYLLAMGQRRAAAAKQYFLEHGIPGDRFDLVSYGDERPVCVEHNEACWQQNRRADFRIVTMGANQAPVVPPNR